MQILFHEGSGPWGLPYKSTLISEAHDGAEPQGGLSRGSLARSQGGSSVSSKGDLTGADCMFLVSFVESQMEESAFDIGNFFFVVAVFQLQLTYNGIFVSCI